LAASRLPDRDAPDNRDSAKPGAPGAAWAGGGEAIRSSEAAAMKISRCGNEGAERRDTGFVKITHPWPNRREAKVLVGIHLVWIQVVSAKAGTDRP
jgi:hypothetical protein